LPVVPVPGEQVTGFGVPGQTLEVRIGAAGQGPQGEEAALVVGGAEDAVATGVDGEDAVGASVDEVEDSRVAVVSRVLGVTADVANVHDARRLAGRSEVLYDGDGGVVVVGDEQGASGRVVIDSGRLPDTGPDTRRRRPREVSPAVRVA